MRAGAAGGTRVEAPAPPAHQGEACLDVGQSDVPDQHLQGRQGWGSEPGVSGCGTGCSRARGAGSEAADARRVDTALGGLAAPPEPPHRVLAMLHPARPQQRLLCVCCDRRTALPTVGGLPPAPPLSLTPALVRFTLRSGAWPLALIGAGGSDVVVRVVCSVYRINGQQEEGGSWRRQKRR